MHDILRRLDLNLLLVFDALYRHRSVVAAADELAMSPSACSHALARLRAAFADDLFVRYGSAMQPTAQADQMAGAIADALRLLTDRLASSGPFSPATSTQAFTFAASDYTMFSLLPGLAARIEQLAPHLRLQVHHSTHRDTLDDLAAGRAHFVMGFSDEYSASHDGIEAIAGQLEDYVVVRCREHARIGGTLSLDRYLAERHIVVVPWTDAGSVIDAALARQGLRRDVAVQLPSMMAAPFIVAGSNFLLTLPKRVAVRLGTTMPLAVHPVPFATPAFRLQVLFHARHASMPGHQWMREQITRTLDSMQ